MCTALRPSPNLKQVDFWLHTRPITWRGIIPSKCYLAHKGGHCTSNHISALISLWGVGGTDTIQQSSLGYYHIVHVQLACCSILALQGQAVTHALIEKTAITVLLYTSLDYGRYSSSYSTESSQLNDQLCIRTCKCSGFSMHAAHNMQKVPSQLLCVNSSTHYVACTAAVNVIRSLSASMSIRCAHVNECCTGVVGTDCSWLLHPTFI